MNLKLKFLPLLVFTFFIFTACSGDDSVDNSDDVSSGCADFETSYEDVMAIANTYINEPNEQNCENYKQAVIEFYEDYRDCTFWTEEYEEDLDDIDDIDCSGTETEN